MITFLEALDNSSLTRKHYLDILSNISNLDYAYAFTDELEEVDEKLANIIRNLRANNLNFRLRDYVRNVDPYYLSKLYKNYLLLGYRPDFLESYKYFWNTDSWEFSTRGWTNDRYIIVPYKEVPSSSIPIPVLRLAILSMLCIHYNDSYEWDEV